MHIIGWNQLVNVLQFRGTGFLLREEGDTDVEWGVRRKNPPGVDLNWEIPV